MAHLIGLYLRLVRIRIKSQMEDRLPFFLELFTVGFMTALGFLTLSFVIQRFSNIGGWTLIEIAFLYGMVELAFGVMDMFFSGFDPSYFGNQVRLGGFDQLLLRPASLTLQVFASEFILRRLGRIVQGGVILAYALSNPAIHWTLCKLLFLPVMVLGLVLFFGGLFIAGATITFWTIDSIEIVNIFTYGGAEMLSYPMHIYPDWLRRFFTYILPAIFLNYYPTLYILDKPDPLGLPPWAAFFSPVAGLALILAAFAFWRFGIRAYQSTGT
jgi:ABC-2 type transport system permease protein